jgi:hypothetical protein
MRDVFADIKSGGIDELPFVTLMAPTIIFMATTIIDPSTERQPHSAFSSSNRQKAN